MKILYLNHNKKGEGTFFRAFNFAKPLAARGYGMTLLTMSPKRIFRPLKYVESGVNIIETPNFLDVDGGGWAPLDVLYRTAHVLRNKYDIIHGFDHKPNVYLPSIAGRRPAGTVLFSDWADLWFHGGINSRGRIKPETLIEKFLDTDIRRKADGLTVTSLELRRIALSIGIDPEKIFYIPSGCDTDRIKPKKPAVIRSLKRKYGIPQKKFVIEFIGFGQADLGILIDGFNELRRVRDDVLFIIVGPLEKRWSGKISSSPFKKDIIITGKVDFSKVSDYAGMADIFLLPLADVPANRGRGPIKAGDYMSAGRPIIANPVGDIGEWIKKYSIGMTAGYSGMAIAEKVLYLLKNRGLMKKLGQNARNTAEKVFSWDKVADKMEKAYKKAVKIKGGKNG